MAEYRIALSRHRGSFGGRTEHYTLVRILRDGREVGRAYSNLYESLTDTVMGARSQARAEGRFLRSLGRVFSAGARHA